MLPGAMERAHLCDPFAAAFAQAVASGPRKDGAAAASSTELLTTEKQWRAFVTILKESGLYSEPDAMEDIWAELVRQGKLYQPEGKVRIQLSFEWWREMLIKRVGSNTEGLDSSLLGIRQHAKVLDDIVSGWDMDGMSAEETRRVLLILATMEGRRTALRSGLSNRCEGDAYHVMLQATWTLLTERVAGAQQQGEAAVASEVDKRAVGAVNNPFRWQFQHMEQVERMGRLRRPRKIRFRTTRRSGPRGEAVRDDVYGVAQGLNGQYGIRVYRGTCEVKEGAEGKEREVFVVAVPATAPHEAACAQVNAYMAHRELSLSGGVLHCLGKDWAASDEALYYYDHAPGVTLQSLLRPERGAAVVLREDGGLLFRYWAGQILRALSDVQVQCCHVLHNRRLGLQNVVVSGKGLRVRLGGLEWGPKISAYREVSGEELRGRMRGLLRDFSGIILDMLGLNSHSCWHGWFSDMGRVLGEGGLERYDHRRALEGVEVGEGDQVAVQLDAQHQRMYTGFDVLPLDGKPAEAAGPVVAVTWEEADTPLAQDLQRLRVSGLRAGMCQVVVRYQDLEATHEQSADGCVRIVVTVKPVHVSPRLKAVLRSCLIASGTGSGLDLQEGAAKAYLGQGKWRDRFSKFWIQDFLANPYFSSMSDAHLDQVIAEYEALFEETPQHAGEEDDEDEEVMRPGGEEEARYLRALNNSHGSHHE